MGLYEYVGPLFSMRCALFWKSGEEIENKGFGRALLDGKVLILARLRSRGIAGGKSSLRSLRGARGMDREWRQDSAVVCVLIPPYSINDNTFQGYSVSILFE
jgi:hypothetical protein